jgi:hypothetical protein
MEPKNLKAAKNLVKKYRSITIEEINKQASRIDTKFDLYMLHFPLGNTVARKLTGFGHVSKCKLCSSVMYYCPGCIYYDTKSEFIKRFCLRGENEKTYRAIADAKTPTKLLVAFKKRADHIEKIIKKLEPCR